MPRFVRDRNYKEGKSLIVLIGVDDEVCNFQDIEGRRNKCEKRRLQSDGCLEKNVTMTLEKTAGIFTRLGGCFSVSLPSVLLLPSWFFKLDIESQELKDEQDSSKEKKKNCLYTFLGWHHTPWCIKDCLMSKPNWKDGLDPEKPVKTKTLEKRTDVISDPKKSKARYKKNQLFMGSLLLISIFYAVTVLQTGQRMGH